MPEASTGGASRDVDRLLRRLRLRHLQLLVLLAEEGSLRAAAGRLALTQPAVSKMLSEIEAAVGERLFERGRRGVVPNAFGLAAVHRARAVLGEVASAVEDLDAVRGGASSVLRVGTVSVTRIVPVAVAALLAREPRVRVRLREARVAELLRILLDGELDCVVGALTADVLASLPLGALRAQRLFEERVVAIASRRHRLAGRGPLRWSEVAAERWVLPPRDTPVRQAFMAAFLNAGVAAPEPVVETLSPVTLGSLLRLDPTLLGAVRRESVDEHGDGGELRALRVGPPIPLPPLGVFTRASAGGADATVAAFVSALRRVARGAGGAARA